MPDIRERYEERRLALHHVAESLSTRTSDSLKEHQHIDRVAFRVKGTSSFITKATGTRDDGVPRYDRPLVEVEDQVAGRVLVFFTSDLSTVRSTLLTLFRSVEVSSRRPRRDDEFGYQMCIRDRYWSVRTLGGVQDLSWAPSLVANVVELKNEPLAVRHIDQLYRYVLTLRAALHLGGIAPLLQAGRPVELHVRGLLLGPSLTEPVAIVDALANCADVPLAVGRFAISPTEGVTFHRSNTEERYWHTALLDATRVTALGAELVGQDSLQLSGGIWTTDRADSPGSP